MNWDQQTRRLVRARRRAGTATAKHLLSTLDGTGAAADSTNFPSELASLY
jgi:hypothetical protein